MKTQLLKISAVVLALMWAATPIQASTSIYPKFKMDWSENLPPIHHDPSMQFNVPPFAYFAARQFFLQVISQERHH